MIEFKNIWKSISDKLDRWLTDFFSMLPNLVIALIVMISTIFIARIVKKYTSKITYKFTSNQTISSVFSSIATAIFIALMLFVILGILNLDKALTSLLAGAGVIGLAVGLALQEPLVNLFSGVMMSVRSLFNVGDLVETNNFFGTIKKIDLRSTLLELPTGELISIPNQQVLQSPLKNYTASGKRKVVIECGVAYDSDLALVRNVARQAIANLIESDPEEVDFYYTDFGGSSINFTLRFWKNDTIQPNILIAKSDAITVIKKAFDCNNIEIPFPIRTLDINMEDTNLASALEKVSVKHFQDN
jgi:small conductance mechanosensitive channel